MFSTQKQNQNKTNSSETDVFFIHTMQDDINGTPAQESTIPSTGERASTPSSSASSTSKELPNAFTSSPFSSQQAPQPALEQNPVSSSSFLEKHSEPLNINDPTPKVLEKIPMPQQSTDSKTINWSLILIILIGLFVLLTITALVYYFLVVNKPQTESPQPIPITQPSENTPEEAEEEPITITPGTQQYSIESPNYLPIDIENSSPEEILKNFINTRDQIKQIKSEKPIEFIATDLNNNPIAFPIFATAAKIKLSPELLSNFEEGFSFYFFQENETVRLGIAVKAKNKELASSLLSKEEKALIDELSFLLLDSSIQNKEVPFATGNYRGYATRYANLNEQSTISIDYIITETRVIIGTSKNTARSILDKVTPATAIEPKSIPVPATNIPANTPTNTQTNTPITQNLPAEKPAAPGIPQ